MKKTVLFFQEKKERPCSQSMSMCSKYGHLSKCLSLKLKAITVANMDIQDRYVWIYIYIGFLKSKEYGKN